MWLVGVVSRRQVWLMGGIYGCGSSIGVVNVCCKEVRIYLDFLILLIPTPFVLALFLQQHPYFFVHFLNVFCSGLVKVF